ncbi:MAG: type I restriction endonuclease subunit R [Pyrinomonadaceae bacterium]
MSERYSVQNPLIRYAAEIGWEYVSPEKAMKMRGGEDKLLFASVLEEQLFALNPKILNSVRAAEILRKLCLLKTSIEGNRDALKWLRGENSVFVSEENRERNVKLVDFENPDNNKFQVTEEWTHKGLIFRNRADVVFLINGVPVAVCETKNERDRDGLAKGIQQIRRYHAETPEMLVTPQVFEVTEMLGFFYAPTWAANRKNIFNWKDEAEGDYERKVKAFFDRERFLKLLRDYIIFLEKDEQLGKVILRQHQTRAVEKAVERVHEPTKRRGLVWHTQGSGKTLTMITIASKLLRESLNPAKAETQNEKPTVLMIVDRNELESQLFKNIDSYGIKNIEIAQSKKDLQRLLKNDYRGLVVSMIHKFDKADENLNPRESIVVLVDEAHRTTGGDLGNYLMGAIPNATYIGFTGTPIDNLARGEGTFKVFGGDDEQGYLDKYSIAESIKDGTTVKLNYALAPSDLLVDRETLEKQFLQLADSEGVSDVEELNAILDNAVQLKELMKAETRIDKIARSVAEHYRQNVEPMGFKAFLVAVDREACMLYKKALDKYLPENYSKVVYSPSHNDLPALKEFYLSDEQEKTVRKEFCKKDAFPKILIVTEKLLTGFDAPILYCMYLDKPMRDHVLLQAIARVNRPYEDDSGLVKPYGFVMDFVGIFEKLETALVFDSETVGLVIQSIEVLEEFFAVVVREQAVEFLPLTKGFDDKAKERAIEYFLPSERRERFFRFFKQLQNLYEIISPDAFLRAFLEDYQKLAELYGLVRKAYSLPIYKDVDFTQKTKELIRWNTTNENLELPNQIHELGAEELLALKQSDAGDTTKILNLRKILAVKVAEESGSKPFLLSIGERAEKLAEAFEQKLEDTKHFLAEFEKLAQEYVDGESERKKLDIDENSFAIYLQAKDVKNDFTPRQAIEINDIISQFPYFKWSSEQERNLRTKLLAKLVPIAGGKHSEIIDKILKLKRI